MFVIDIDYDNTDVQRQTITIDLSLPKDAIQDTGSAIAYIKSRLRLLSFFFLHINNGGSQCELL